MSGSAPHSPELPLEEPWLADGTAARFEAVAARHPGRLAMRSGADEWTYAALDTAANRMANALLARLGGRPRPGSFLALLLDQGPLHVVGALAAWKAGLAILPLDPGHPAARHAEMVDDARPTAIVAAPVHADRARTLADERTEVLVSDEALERFPADRPGAAGAPGELAYVLYTSGSTGRPKGVLQTHAALLHNALRHARRFAITPDDRQTLLYPCSVYGGLRDTWNALLCGASLHHYPVREAGYADLRHWLADERITIYCSVATVFRHFARDLVGRGLYPDLRIVKLGGEAPHPDDVALFREHFSKRCVLHCGLGSTEAGMVRHFPIAQDTVLPAGGIPLGAPVEGVELRLLDGEGRPVPDGAVGEIAIRSRYVTLGYLGRDELNQRVLLRDPEDSAARIFLTGDLGVVAADGQLYHRGRKDQQVKIRGNRVEPTEIEATLAGLPGVREAAVVARPDAAGELQLVAYLVLRAGEPAPTVRALRLGLAGRLPRFAIPGTYAVLDALPQTPNGKLDRRALSEPEGHLLASGQAIVEPTTLSEERLVALWRRLLGRQQIGVTDHFFDLGGDSLRAVDLLVEIERGFGHAPPLARLLETPTIERIAAWLDDGHAAAPTPNTVTLSEGTPGVPPLFLLPGKGGTVLSYRELVRRLGGARPAIGLQYPGLTADDEPIDRVDRLAETLLARVREAQPHGPYHLLGYSFGGAVAYEMACRLRGAGEAVALLALIDTTAPAARSRRRALRRALRRLRERVHRGREADSPLARRLRRLVRASERAFARFRPRPYDGPVWLLRCEHPEDGRALGWAGLIRGPLHQRHVPSRHLEIFQLPHVALLAAVVEAVVAESRGAAPGPPDPR